MLNPLSPASQELKEQLRACHFHSGVNYKEECRDLALAYLDAWHLYRSTPWNPMHRAGTRLDAGGGRAVVVPDAAAAAMGK